MRDFLGVALAIVGMLGCEQKDADPQDGTAGTSGTSGTTTTDSGATSTSGMSEPTTGASAAPETASGTSAAPETGGGDGAALCEAFCGRLVECDLGGLFDDCPCAPEDLDSGPKCAAAWAATVSCFDAEPCAALESEESPCWMTYGAAIQQCFLGEDGCGLFQVSGGEMPPGGCTFGEECVDAPEKLVTCDATMCACTIGGAPAGTCAPEGVCEDFDLAAGRIAACCDA